MADCADYPAEKKNKIPFGEKPNGIFIFING
jgi:hypothetical protein